MSSLAKNYNRRKIAFNKGKGSFLYSNKGQKYLDFPIHKTQIQERNDQQNRQLEILI